MRPPATRARKRAANTTYQKRSHRPRQLDDPIKGLKADNYKWARDQREYDQHAGWRRDWMTGAFGFSTKNTMFVHLVGKIVKAPKLRRQGARAGNKVPGVECWFRVRVEDPSMIGRLCELSVRILGEDGPRVYANAVFGDWISLVGYLCTGRIYGRNFTYLLADRATLDLPVVMEHDRRYIRVRADLWNQLLVQAGRKDLRPVLEPPHTAPAADSVPEAEWEKHFAEIIAPDIADHQPAQPPSTPETAT